MSLSDKLPAIVINENTRGVSVGTTGGLSTTIILGTASKGETNSPQAVSTVSRLIELFGNEDVWDMDNTPTPLGLVRTCKLYLKHSDQLYAMRVAGSSAEKASIKLLPDELQSQEFIGEDGVDTYTLKVIPANLSGKTATATIDGVSKTIVYDTDSPGAGEIALLTKDHVGTKDPGSLVCGDAISGGEVIDVSFYIELDDIQIIEIKGNSKGTWAQDIELYIETSQDPATIENEEIAGSDGVDTYSLTYDNVSKAVVNDFFLQNKTDVNDTKTIRPIYVKSNTLNHKGEKTFADALDDDVKQVAQIFKTADSITIDSVKVVAKSDGNTDALVVRIEELNDDGEPDGTLIDADATGSSDPDDFSTDPTTIEIDLNDTVVLSSNTEYALVLKNDGNTDTIEVQAIDYDEDENPSYEDGNYLYNELGTSWDDTNKENSLMFSIEPAESTINAGQIVLFMRSWGDISNLSNVAKIKINDTDLENIENYNIIATYRVSPNSNVRKLIVTYGNSIEEYVILSGNDLARDINRESAFIEAEADDTNGNLVLSAIENGSKEYPLSLDGGNNGSEATPTDYNTALQQLKYLEDYYFVVIASQGRYNYQTGNSVDGTDDLEQLHSNLRSFIKERESKGIEKVAICGMRPIGSSESRSDFELNSDDSISARLDTIADRDGRMNFVGHGVEMTDEAPDATSSVVVVPGCITAGLYAGLWASLPENQTTGGEALNGVTDLEFDLGYEDKRIITQLGAVCFEKRGGIRVVRGVTADPTGKFYDCPTRRILDYIYARVRAILFPLLNTLNEPDLWNTVTNLLVAEFENLAVRKFILDNYYVEVGANRAQQNEGLVIIDVGVYTVKPVIKFVFKIRLG